MAIGFCRFFKAGLFAVLAPALILLAGCQDELKTQQATVDVIVQQIRDAAGHANDAWHAQLLAVHGRALLDLALHECERRNGRYDLFLQPTCPPSIWSRGEQRLIDLQWQYYQQAVHQPIPAALKTLWKSGSAYCVYQADCLPGECRRPGCIGHAGIPVLRQEMADATVALARKSTDPELLQVAALILLSDQWVSRDIATAIRWLEASYRLGRQQAAGDLAAAYESIGDHRAAYLWTLRCLQNCRRPVDAAVLRSRLPVSDVLAVEADVTAAATDLSSASATPVGSPPTPSAHPTAGRT